VSCLTNMSEPLWSPTPEQVEASQLTQFSRWLENQTGQQFSSYEELHKFSITHPGRFWDSYWHYTGIISSKQANEPVADLELFPGARWFPEASLNYAENLLQEHSSKVAFVSILENGERTTTSYQSLFDQTQSIASQLASLNIAPGDRIAGWLPNITQAAVAMLACSSAGAVWSSCSPDFGASGALDRFGQIEPRVLFACDGYLYGGKTIDITDKVRAVAAAVPSIQKIVWISIINRDLTLFEGEEKWDTWLKKPSRPLIFKQLPFDHPLFIVYSSGTTGMPKCIVHSQGGTLIQHKKEHQLHVDLRPQDTLFFFTTCGWMMWNWLISALASKCTIVLFDGSPFQPTPAAMFDICETENVTVFGISAKFLSGTQKVGVKPVASHDLSHMRMLLSTGSPLSEESYRYVYNDVKPQCHLVSMSGGTDLLSCFLIGNPNKPVYEGELQSAGLGMAVDIWDENGHSLVRNQGGTQGLKGELVCTVSFPSCPIAFWNDPGDQKFKAAYFDRFPNIWVHGDYIELTQNDGYIIHGRSDAVLNPGGVRIGTAEIYRQVEHFDEIIDSVCVGQNWKNDVRVLLFVVMRENTPLTTELTSQIKQRIREHASPRHTPSKIIAVGDIPRTMSGKIAELAVKDVLHNRPVKNTSALANPESLKNFEALSELQPYPG